MIEGGIRMKQNYLKEVKGRYKAEYVADNPFTCEGLKSAIANLLVSEGFDFESIELTDDTNLFDGGTRLSCSVIEETNDFIEKNFNDEITEIIVFGKYDDTKVCLTIMKDENLIRTSCRENIDISVFLKNF